MGRTSSSRPGHLLLRDGVRPLLLAADLAACAVAAVITQPRSTTVLFTTLFVLLLASAGLYRPRLSLSILDTLPRIVLQCSGAVGLTLLCQAVASRLRWHTEIVNWGLVTTATIALGLLLVTRGVAFGVVRRLRRRRSVAHRTLILGAGRVGGQLAETLDKHGEYGLLPVGFLDDDPLIQLQPESRLPLLGGTRELADAIVDHDVRVVIVAFTAMSGAETVDVIRTCDRLRCEIFLVPRLFELHHVDSDMETVWGIPLVRLRRAAYRSVSWRVKRALDVTISGLALVALSPVMLLIAAAVACEGGRGVLFRQERVGVDGRHFSLLKFRSLRPASDAESATTWSIAHDSRLGPVGAFLRRTSLDELPQLLNILRGDMSLVGPRPERPHFVDEFRRQYPRYIARNRVPSGLTGWAQVHGLRGDTSIADRAAFDNFYIENWSLWLDVKILLRTARSVLAREGA